MLSTRSIWLVAPIVLAPYCGSCGDITSNTCSETFSGFEVCDGRDNDCDQRVDENCSTLNLDGIPPFATNLRPEAPYTVDGDGRVVFLNAAGRVQFLDADGDVSGRAEPLRDGVQRLARNMYGDIFAVGYTTNSTAREDKGWVVQIDGRRGGEGETKVAVTGSRMTNLAFNPTNDDMTIMAANSFSSHILLEATGQTSVRPIAEVPGTFDLTDMAYDKDGTLYTCPEGQLLRLDRSTFIPMLTTNMTCSDMAADDDGRVYIAGFEGDDRAPNGLIQAYDSRTGAAFDVVEANGRILQAEFDPFENDLLVGAYDPATRQTDFYRIDLGF